MNMTRQKQNRIHKTWHVTLLWSANQTPMSRLLSLLFLRPSPPLCLPLLLLPSRTSRNSLGARFLVIGSIEIKSKRLRMPESKKKCCPHHKVRVTYRLGCTSQRTRKKATTRRVPDFVFEQEKHPYLKEHFNRQPFTWLGILCSMFCL
jgi:hypothetical protein